MPWFNRWFNSRRILFASVLILVGIGACGPMTAVELNGTEIRAKVTDFRFVGAVEQCVLEVRAGKPYALIVDCWAVGKQLFVGCLDCGFSSWGAALREDTAARIQIDDAIYPVRASLMRDPIAIQRAWHQKLSQAGMESAEQSVVQALPESFWLFHLASSGSSKDL